jgi:glucosylceramidase
MGGSDLQAVETYTYDDVPNGQTDYNLDHFSIDKDRQFFIPVIKEALAVNPNLKLLGTPWSAPAWMKESHTLNGGQFKSDTRVYQTYAMYFVKFIEAYKAEGIPIEALAVQNEPLYETNGYPTMKMTAEQQTVFIRDHLGPLFRQRNIHTKILIFDHNWSDAWYPEQVVSDG